MLITRENMTRNVVGDVVREVGRKIGGRPPEAGGGGDGFAKSIILDLTDNYGYDYFVGIRSVEFKLSSVLIPLTGAALTCYDTSHEPNGGYLALDAFSTDRLKDGTDERGYLSEFNNNINQRIICVCTTPIEFDEVVINNYTNGGVFVTPGAQNIKVYYSSDEITSTVYGEAIANSTLIYDSTIAIHDDTGGEDDQVLTLINMP